MISMMLRLVFPSRRGVTMTTSITTSVITTPSAGTFVYLLTNIYQSFSFKLSVDGTISITEYCHTSKNLVDTLDDVGTPVSEQELVLQILRNLPASCHSIVNVITNTKPFPSFLDVGNTLLLHESREDNSKDTTDVVASPSTALFTTTDNIGKCTNRTNKNIGNGHGDSKGAGNSNGFISGGGFAGNTSGTSPQHAQRVFHHWHTHSAPNSV
ncbi:hypothetical protein Tco_1350356 [Tanacetum coccineum]